MKKIWMIVLVALTGCQAKKSTTEALQQAIPLSEQTLISIDDASLLISDYLTNSRVDLSSYTLGGVLPVADFIPDEKNEGLLMWYCFDAATKQLFMAVEPYQHYDTANLPKAPVQAALKKPETTFLYTGASPTEKNVKDFILNQKITGPSTRIDNALVSRFVTSFDSLMQKTTDGAGVTYQKYPFNYFIWGTDYKTFVNWAGKDGFIRYYLGFGERYKPNRIRIILIATDKDGNTKTGTLELYDDGGQGLQNGWPPPPFG
jgi:hypothetical protein